MAQPNPSDLLNQIEQWTTAPDSPLMQKVRKQLAPLEQKARGLDEKSPEYKKLSDDYRRQAAQLLLTEIQGQFGGKIPDRKQMEADDFRARSKGDPAVEKQLRESSAAMPYERGYNILEQLQKISGQAQEVPVARLQEPGAPTKLAPPAPRSLPKPLPKPAESDDEKLTESQMLMLYNLAGAGTPDPRSFYEADEKFNGVIPSKQAPQRDAATLPPEQQAMEAYKKAFDAHETGDSNTYAQMPLPPGWVRSPEGTPITAPTSAVEPGGKEDVEKAIRANMLRMLMQESGALKDVP